MNDSWLDRNRNIVFIILLFVTLGGGVAFYLRQPDQNPVEIHQVELEATATSTPVPSPTPTPAPVRVYITGAVVNSDVYFLPQGSIVKDAIVAAGGFTPDADQERINQALELKDQQHIHVSYIGEENPPPPVQGGATRNDSSDDGGGSTTVSSDSSIDLNRATLEQLDSLPGIGPAIAQRIIDYRDNIGGFKSIEEITQVSGIGEATFAKIKDHIIVE